MSKPTPETSREHRHRGRHIWLILLGLFIALSGLYFIVGGAMLMTSGGSWYYLLAGLGLAASGIQLIRGRISGVWIYGLVFLGTLIWALFIDSGFVFWPQVPRLGLPAGVGLVVFLSVFCFPKNVRAGMATTGAVLVSLIFAAGLAGLLAGLFFPHGEIKNAYTPLADTSAAPVKVADAKTFEWRQYGATPAGTRYVPLDQITKENVKDLELAWTYRTGDIATKGADDQNTPIQVGDTLYVCTAHNIVIALNAETGKERWRYDTKSSAKIWQRCRGVSYFDQAVGPMHPEGGTAPATGTCSTRIITNTTGGHLFALDAKTGAPCADFGTNGNVDVKVGLGKIDAVGEEYLPTSAPTVIGNLVIMGSFVLDNYSNDEPSGVIRAFSAVTGEVVWAWDLGNLAITKLPPEGQTYTRSTPNSWSTPAYDLKLGMIYLPMGNGTPDMYAADRDEATEKHSSSVVALDIATGREKWTFQTVHHDMWDFDIPAQPALVDLPDGKGGIIPALVQLTKRGQIFMLDRRDGKSLTEIVEKPVPQGPVAGDRLSPTQPYPVGIPSVNTELLTEARMWGMTPFDQLYCRIWFRHSRYEGDFTPHSLQGTILYPSLIGGFNWGSATVDEVNKLIFLNDMSIPVWVRILTREEYKTYEDDPKKVKRDAPYGFIVPMKGTPYGAIRTMMFTPLGVPCNEPPFGTYTVIDLVKRAIVWQSPAGTVQDSGPMGITTHLPLPVGMPTLGGGATTSTGITFHAGAMDFFLRAINTQTGEELWKGRLPIGSQGTPVPYISPESGREFVVLSVGGDRASPTANRGDYIYAFALPKKK